MPDAILTIAIAATAFIIASASAAVLSPPSIAPNAPVSPLQPVRYPRGHPYYQETRTSGQSTMNRINGISDLDPHYARRAMKDVHTTIAEVQKILASNPHLPRLTRGEIEELFENVTREEFEKSMRNGDRSRAKHMRALMVVLPYNTNNYSDDALQDLYTRPPMTRVLGGDGDRIVRPQQIVIGPQSTNHNPTAGRPAPTTYKPQLNGKPQPPPTTFHPHHKSPVYTQLPAYAAPSRPPPTAEAPTTTTTSTTPTPTAAQPTTARPSADLYNAHFSAHNLPFVPQQPSVPALQQQQPPARPSSDTPALHKRPHVKDLLRTIGLTDEVTTPRPAPAQLTPEMRELLSSFGLLTNEQPPSHLNVQQQQPQPPEFLQFPEHPPQQDEFLPMDVPSAYHAYNADSSAQQHSRFESLHPLEFDPNAPELPPSDESPAPTFNLAELFPHLADANSATKNYRMHDAPEPLAGDYYAFKPLPVAADFEPSQASHRPTDNMEEFLRSFGLLDTASNRNKKSIRGDEEANAATQSTTSTTPRTTTAMNAQPKALPRIERMPAVQVDFLSPQLLSVLGNIGVDTDRHAPTVFATRRSDDIRRSVDEVANVRSDKQPPVQPIRLQKPTKATLPAVADVETPKPTKRYPVFRADQASASSDHVMIVLPTIGEQPSTTATPVPLVQPVVSPDEAARDYAKLQFLLATVRKLQQQNGTLSDEDLERLDVNKLNLSETLMRYTNGAKAPNQPATVAAGPDPVLSESLRSQLAKNEVKRQSGDSTNATPTTPTTPSSTSTATDDESGPVKYSFDLSAVTEETPEPIDSEKAAASVAALLAANEDEQPKAATSTSTTTTTLAPLLSSEIERANGLEDSFPGGLDPVTEEPLPPPRRNGFYFFTDWNSFLEVGEDPDKVVVRFDPKIGDSSQFVKVRR